MCCMTQNADQYMTHFNMPIVFYKDFQFLGFFLRQHLNLFKNSLLIYEGNTNDMGSELVFCRSDREY